jgi:tRNA(fMet)-specific endonuclease VapC
LSGAGIHHIEEKGNSNPFERTGKIIGPMDLLIVAHALAENAALVTNNEREFRRVEGLVVENWAAL